MEDTGVETFIVQIIINGFPKSYEFALEPEITIETVKNVEANVSVAPPDTSADIKVDVKPPKVDVKLGGKIKAEGEKSSDSGDDKDKEKSKKKSGQSLRPFSSLILQSTARAFRAR